MPITLYVIGERTSTGRFEAIDSGQKRCPQTRQRDRDVMVIAHVMGIANNAAIASPINIRNKVTNSDDPIPVQLIPILINAKMTKITNIK